MVKCPNIKPEFASYETARKYGHKLMLTPPYHCELRPLEKVWSMTKNPIALNPDMNKTSTTLQAKLEEPLKSTPEHSLLSVCMKSIDVAKQYLKEYDENFQPLQLIEE